MTFTVALEIGVVTPSGIEEKIQVPAQELTTELAVEIKGKIADLFGGENQIQATDVVKVSGSITSSNGGNVSLENETFTVEEVSAFSDLVKNAFN